ncbi:MAG TPA: aminoglycoside phosphotransferase family protein, partial [Bacillales bacterium]|nr:aminoglycoside phosphotransferase family protein [Bacillales bacterium]
QIQHETYSSNCRDVVREFYEQISTRNSSDPVSEQLAEFWKAKRSVILTMVDRADELAHVLMDQDPAYVLCHGDLHPGNVLVCENGELRIVDWDDPIYAPKEHDLMCFGGGLGFAGESRKENELFYKGYGQCEIDPEALAYYRYERIVADVAAFGEEIFGQQGSVEDRKVSLKLLMNQFQPNEVVEAAHKTYEKLF